MGFRKTVRKQAAPFLQAGETIDAVFGATYGAAATRSMDRIVVVTDRRILVFPHPPFGIGIHLKGVPQELPRSVRLLSAGKYLNIECPVLGPDVIVSWYYFKDLRAADKALDSRSGPPD